MASVLVMLIAVLATREMGVTNPPSSQEVVSPQLLYLQSSLEAIPSPRTKPIQTNNGSEKGRRNPTTVTCNLRGRSGKWGHGGRSVLGFKPKYRVATALLT